MGSLSSIPVRVESLSGSSSAMQNNTLLLHEIRHALVRLADTGESTQIDLSAMPFGPGELDQLLTLLGHGEVEASLDALGATRVEESAYPGVWIVEHLSTTGERLSVQLEITRLPALLMTPEQDVIDSSNALSELLNNDLSSSQNVRGNHDV